MSSFSRLLHWPHVSPPKGDPTPFQNPARTLPEPCQNSLPSNLHQGTTPTRASKADHFPEKSFKLYHAVRARRVNSFSGNAVVAVACSAKWHDEVSVVRRCRELYGKGQGVFGGGGGG